jgi:2-polyprenyl-3-methyl-5-hydroxy-6-metoxy-1,4-benzoquinol methylase
MSAKELLILLTNARAHLPRDRHLVAQVSAAADRLYEALAVLEAERLDISTYNKTSFAAYQRKLRTKLQKFAFELCWSLAANRKPPQDTVLLDYGGGTGIVSLLAKECGVGSVIYNDIYDVSCLDAETIAQALGLEADHYICGEMRDVATFLNGISIACDVVVSSDVIEHVYDVSAFFHDLRSLPSEHLSIALSTHANPLNPVVNRILMQKQRAVEHQDRQYTPGHKKRDSLQSYLGIRRDIIRRCADGLSDEVIERLARVTRGMDDNDIQSTVECYLEDRVLPPAPKHPTNTCDPWTGNWADRLADPHELRVQLAQAGFDAEIVCGCYGTPHGRLKQAAAGLLDGAIRYTGTQGLRFAPYFVLHGVRRAADTMPMVIAETAAKEPRERREVLETVP